MATLTYTMVPNAKTMREYARAMARELRRIAKELDRRGVQLYEGTVEYVPEVRTTSVKGYRMYEATGFEHIVPRLKYFSPHRRKTAGGEAAGE